MKNKKFLLLGLLLAAAIFLVGCTEAPKPAPTEAPVVTDAPSDVEEAVEEAKEAAEEVKEATEEAVEEAKDTVEGVVADAKEAIEELKNKVLAALEKKEPIELTLEELAHFNGKDGMRAFVAVDGIIYDVTDSPAWKDGEHNGNLAGKDLTKEIKEDSPHGIGKLENVVEVGKIKE